MSLTLLAAMYTSERTSTPREGTSSEIIARQNRVASPSTCNFEHVGWPRGEKREKEPCWNEKGDGRLG